MVYKPKASQNGVSQVNQRKADVPNEENDVKVIE